MKADTGDTYEIKEEKEEKVTNNKNSYCRPDDIHSFQLYCR